jgi:hypothetical protein
MLKKLNGIIIIFLILSSSLGVSFAADTESREIDPYTDLGFKKFEGFKTVLSDVPEGNGAWHDLRTNKMPFFSEDLNNLKAVMDYNAALVDKLYANWYS